MPGTWLKLAEREQLIETVKPVRLTPEAWPSDKLAQGGVADDEAGGLFLDGIEFSLLTWRILT